MNSTAFSMPASASNRTSSALMVGGCRGLGRGISERGLVVADQRPDLSPRTARRILAGSDMSKTIIGMALSMQREKAVESITSMAA